MTFALACRTCSKVLAVHQAVASPPEGAIYVHSPCDDADVHETRPEFEPRDDESTPLMFRASCSCGWKADRAHASAEESAADAGEHFASQPQPSSGDWYAIACLACGAAASHAVRDGDDWKPACAEHALPRRYPKEHRMPIGEALSGGTLAITGDPLA